MAQYRKKPVVIEAITFDELVEHGRANGGNVVNGMPWSFAYRGHPITHESDDCYLIPTLEGTMKLMRGDYLITGVNGEIYPCKPDIFLKTYERVDEGDTAAEPPRTVTLSADKRSVFDKIMDLARSGRSAQLEFVPDAFFMKECELRDGKIVRMTFRSPEDIERLMPLRNEERGHNFPMTIVRSVER